MSTKVTIPDTNLPTARRADSSYFAAETKEMERRRRLMEQDGERRIARVNAREHNTSDNIGDTPEEAADNGMLQHPYLDNQRFDGIEPNLNPEPPLSSAARREFDNKRREQAQELQNRLGNTPKYSNAPKPRGPY